MRNFFANEIYKKIKKDKKVILLSADIGNQLFDKIKKDFKNNFINCGIAEPNMISFACGLSNQGYIPICYTITNFLIYKTIEQIRNDAIYNQNKIILVGTGSGLSYNHLGTTHFSLEDIGLINTLPKINIFSPADNEDLSAHINFSLKIKESSYIRLGKKNEKLINKKKVEFGDINLVSKGSKKAIISTGPLIDLVQNSIEDLELKPSLYNFHHLKGFNKNLVFNKLKKYDEIFTIEEHYHNTGIYSILTNLFGHTANKIININNNLDFLKKIGSRKFVRKIHGISKYNIIKKLKND
jgi:transketolase